MGTGNRLGAGPVAAGDHFVHGARGSSEAALGAYSSLAHDAAVAEVGLMLRVSSRTAVSRVNEALSLCTQLPGTLAALEAGRITLAKARILDAETMNLSAEPVIV